MDQENCNSIPGPSQSTSENKGTKRKLELSYTHNKKILVHRAQIAKSQVNNGNEAINPFSLSLHSKNQDLTRI